MDTLGRTAWALAALLPALLLPTGAARAEGSPRGGLDELRRLALLEAPELEAAEARVGFDEARLEEARVAPLDLGQLGLNANPTRERLGAVELTDRDDAPLGPEMGLWLGFNVEVALALTPWWLIVELWRAAEGAVDMSRHQLAAARAELAMAVERAYREAQVAADSTVALRRATRSVDETMALVERQIEGDADGAGEADRLRLVVVRAELDARRAAVDRDRRRALARLRRLAGLPAGAPIALDPLVADAAALAPLGWLLEAARRLRPEVGLSLAGVRAAQVMIRARQAESVPEVAMGAYYGLRTTPVVDDQGSPWVEDPWNGQGFGYGLVYRWAPSPGERAARVLQARSDLAYARALRDFALRGIAFQVESAYADVTEDAAVLRARERTRDLSARRYQEIVARHAQGATRPGELSDAARELADLELSCVQATGRLMISRAQLSLATGELVP